MVRISKQQERRHVSPRRPTCSAPRAESTACQREKKVGYRVHVNALEGELASKMFIPKIRGSRG